MLVFVLFRGDGEVKVRLRLATASEERARIIAPAAKGTEQQRRIHKASALTQAQNMSSSRLSGRSFDIVPASCGGASSPLPYISLLPPSHNPPQEVASILRCCSLKRTHPAVGRPHYDNTAAHHVVEVGAGQWEEQ